MIVILLAVLGSDFTVSPAFVVHEARPAFAVKAAEPTLAPRLPSPACECRECDCERCVCPLKKSPANFNETPPIKERSALIPVVHQAIAGPAKPVAAKPAPAFKSYLPQSSCPGGNCTPSSAPRRRLFRR